MSPSPSTTVRFSWHTSPGSHDRWFRPPQPPAPARVREMAAAVASDIEHHSECIMVLSISSARYGSKCVDSNMEVYRGDLDSSLPETAATSGVKWRPARAAAEPVLRANIV